MDKKGKKCHILSMQRSSLLIFSKEIYRIFHLYYSLHGVRITLFSSEGEKVYPRDDQPNCEYCRQVREELGYDRRCRDLDLSMIESCMKENRMITYCCHGGMQEAALPVIVDGRPQGCVILGQFRREGEPLISPYEKQWRERFGDSRLKDAFEKAPVYTSEKIPVLLEMYQIILRYISREKMIRSGDWTRILPVLERLEESPSLNPTLEEASEWISKSPSTTTRLFKKITGFSFKNYIIRYKIDLAEEKMKCDPLKTISEIAWELGFRDPLYFSRIYSRYRGISPGKFKEGINRIVEPEDQVF